MGNAHSLLTYVPVSELQLTEAKLCHPPAQLWAWQAFGRIRLMAPPTALLCSSMPVCPPLFFRNVTTKFRFCCKRISAVLPGDANGAANCRFSKRHAEEGWKIHFFQSSSACVWDAAQPCVGEGKRGRASPYALDGVAVLCYDKNEGGLCLI